MDFSYENLELSRPLFYSLISLSSRRDLSSSYSRASILDLASFKELLNFSSARVRDNSYFDCY